MNAILKDIVEESGRLTIGGVPEGYDALLVSDLARAHGTALHVARDDGRAQQMSEALQFFAPDVEVVHIPAWDCLPYDRVSPRAEIVSQRMAALNRLVEVQQDTDPAPLIVVTTVNAVLQRLPDRVVIAESRFPIAIGNMIDLGELTAFLERNGYRRASTVMEPGDFAVRGGIVDIYPPSFDEPLRVDFFGDTVDGLRHFDPTTQRTTTRETRVELMAVSEVALTEESIARFRSGYRDAFGAVTDEDPLYEAVSAGRHYAGMEHWLPLFHESMETIFDYLEDAIVSLDHQAEEAIAARLELIADYFDARKAALDQSSGAKAFSTANYKPLPGDALYLTKSEWDEKLIEGRSRLISPFQLPEAEKNRTLGGKRGRDFAPERAQENVNVFDAVANYIDTVKADKRKVLISSWTHGSRERLSGVLSEHGVTPTPLVDVWGEAMGLGADDVGLIVLPLESGFETDEFVVISEQDILGDRLVRRQKSRRADNFLREASSLSPGDLVVHVDHGIGRYEGLKTIDVTGAPHDCLQVLYHNDDKLYLPVENIELLSRYGSEDLEVQLDRLGGAGWQARKAKLKERLRDIADQLIKVAAARELRTADATTPPTGIYDEFCARFPYTETEDQENAIEDVLEDLAKGRPMDRLVCGDVGFGKTEVALRTAFVMAMEGRQVAVIVPTTLLCRQHYKTFKERFEGLPVRIEQLSRMVANKEATEIKKQLAEGQVDIVIGTHALLGKSIDFKNLGLLVIDEEQHFGVTHKERLKSLRADVHVLTLSATPIPRTLQLALSGVRELSLIATPPVDRLAVRTFVSPFDPVIIREALLREHYRGGQSFYVCPRISDLPEAEEFLKERVPEVKVVTAHGQMTPGQLDDVMNAFYDRKYDVLLSTTIVESGLDIPNANTLVIHRADRFGLSQLYQLRGRIGRAKARAYAYLTVPPNRKLTANAERRLEVLQALDTLGAGFSLASHDLDIRGAGNLLGDEQSGHIKEVGFELYQEMLEEAVSSLRSGADFDDDGRWSPQINIGTAVLIPDHFVPDLDVRLALYRRLSELEDPQEIEGFAAELIDRFGELPEEVEHLMKIVAIKQLCRTAGVENIDAGPKGATLSFRNNEFANPEGLIAFINRYSTTTKVRPDQKLVYKRDWPSPQDRLEGTQHLLSELEKLVRAAEKAA